MWNTALVDPNSYFHDYSQESDSGRVESPAFEFTAPMQIQAKAPRRSASTPGIRSVPRNAIELDEVVVTGQPLDM